LRIFPLLTALFVGLPLLDTVALVLLGGRLGFWPTVALTLLSGVVGAWLAKHQGRTVWTTIRRDFSAGRMPDQGVLDGICILVAAGMLMAPGFLTDFVALALLLPAVRAPITAYARRRLMQQFSGNIRII
jgi:UPF0716 protein FxsA